MAVDWYRQTTWDAANEQLFEEKLKRARMKQDYLRIQACTLASTRPEAALQLLERYFAYPINFDNASAHVDRATALTALGRYEEAVASYEAALAREAQFPNLLTNSWLDLPYLIATRNLRAHYERALELLKDPEHRLMFPFQLFRWHAAYALILHELKEWEQARVRAEEALQAAASQDSGFRYHAGVGLVGEAEQEVVAKLKSLLGEKATSSQAGTSVWAKLSRLARTIGLQTVNDEPLR